MLHGAGRGLYTTRAFAAGDWVTEYDGRLIDHDAAKRLRSAGMDTHVRTIRAQHSYIDGRLVQATHGRGGGSFANDVKARQRQFYNCEFVVIDQAIPGCVQRESTVNSRGNTRLEVPERVMLRALRRIVAGEEIYVDYGAGYWDLRPVTGAATATATVAPQNATPPPAKFNPNPKNRAQSRQNTALRSRAIKTALRENKRPPRQWHQNIGEQKAAMIVSHNVLSTAFTPWDIAYEVKLENGNVEVWRDKDFHGGINRQMLAKYAVPSRDRMFAKLPLANKIYGNNPQCGLSCCDVSTEYHYFI